MVRQRFIFSIKSGPAWQRLRNRQIAPSFWKQIIILSRRITVWRLMDSLPARTAPLPRKRQITMPIKPQQKPNIRQMSHLQKMMRISQRNVGVAAAVDAGAKSVMVRTPLQMSRRHNHQIRALMAPQTRRLKPHQMPNQRVRPIMRVKQAKMTSRNAVAVAAANHPRNLRPAR